MRPKIVLWWGIALTVVAALLRLYLPNISFFFDRAANSATGVDEGFLVGLNLIAQVVEVTVSPLGAVLIGSSIVMAYLTPRPSE